MATEAKKIVCQSAPRKDRPSCDSTEIEVGHFGWASGGKDEFNVRCRKCGHAWHEPSADDGAAMFEAMQVVLAPVVTTQFVNPYYAGLVAIEFRKRTALSIATTTPDRCDLPSNAFMEQLEAHRDEGGTITDVQGVWLLWWEDQKEWRRKLAAAVEGTDEPERQVLRKAMERIAKAVGYDAPLILMVAAHEHANAADFIASKVEALAAGPR